METGKIERALEEGAKALDITPTMFEEARTHYNALAQFLESRGLDVEIYPFGSIATGTVVRPKKNGKDSFFDFDIAARRRGYTRTSSPAQVRDPVRDELLCSDRYENRTEESNECITVSYVSDGINDGFKIDLNVCIDDVNPWIGTSISKMDSRSSERIAIARKCPESWLGSNPKGLARWFNERNARFAAHDMQDRKAALFREWSGIYTSIEDVPEQITRSSLQRAVQVAKRSRDEYYSRANKERLKPASCVITVLFGNIANKLPDDAGIAVIVRAFISEAPRLIGTCGAWSLENPVYEENLLDEWTDAQGNMFHKWLKVLGDDMAQISLTGQRRCAAFESLFGEKAGKRAAAVISPSSTSSVPIVVTPQKPWGPNGR